MRRGKASRQPSQARHAQQTTSADDPSRRKQQFEQLLTHSAYAWYMLYRELTDKYPFTPLTTSSWGIVSKITRELCIFDSVYGLNSDPVRR